MKDPRNQRMHRERLERRRGKTIGAGTLRGSKLLRCLAPAYASGHSWQAAGKDEERVEAFGARFRLLRLAVSTSGERSGRGVCQNAAPDHVSREELIRALKADRASVSFYIRLLIPSAARADFRSSLRQNRILRNVVVPQIFPSYGQVARLKVYEGPQL